MNDLVCEDVEMVAGLKAAAAEVDGEKKFDSETPCGSFH
jgi:hypothetical protein